MGSRVIRFISFCLNVRTIILISHCNELCLDDEVLLIHLPNLRHLQPLGHVPIELLQLAIPTANVAMKVGAINIVGGDVNSVTQLFYLFILVGEEEEMHHAPNGVDAIIVARPNRSILTHAHNQTISTLCIGTGISIP